MRIYLDEEMPLLILQCGGHEQRQDLVEQWPRTKLPRLVRHLAQRSLHTQTHKIVN